MFDITALVILHEEVLDHTLNFLAWLQVVVLLKVQSNHVDLVDTDLAIYKFHGVFIFAVGVLALTFRFKSTQQRLEGVC